MNCSFCGALLPSLADSCPHCGKPPTNQRDTETLSVPRPDAPQGSGAGPAAPTAAATHIGDFRIVRLLGRGGMGAVYEAYQESMHRKVALKVLESGSEPSADSVSRFEREAWIGGRLKHANIVKVHGQGIDGAKRWISMELIQGGSLHQAVREATQHRFERERTEPGWYGSYTRRMVRLFVDLADALAHVHGQGVVHRDIKPLNLLLDREQDRLVLTDFGLARDPEESRLTRHGDFMGTIRYMSPEQLLANRAKVDYRSDIWSLGVSLYEAVTFELPFKAPTEEGYIGAVSMKDPIPARVWNRNIPRDLETVLMKCLERDPERRYQSAALLRDDLVRFLEDRPVQARRVGFFATMARRARRRRGLVTASAAAAVIAAVSIGVIAGEIQSRRQLERIRWTLEQVIASGADPAALQPDWPQLLDRMIRDVRRRPTGEFALLAARASCTARVRVSSYGSITEQPTVEVQYGSNFFPGCSVLFATSLEARIDEGPWTPFAGNLSGFARVTRRSPLNTFIGQRVRDPGPHRLEVRSTYVVLDSLRASRLHVPFSVEGPSPIGWIQQRAMQVQVYTGFSGGKAAAIDSSHNFAIGRRLDPARLAALCAVIGKDSIITLLQGGMDQAALDARVRNIAILLETRPIGTYAVNLFQRYPDDFPRAIRHSDASETHGAWFAIDRVRILRVDLPEKHPFDLCFAWPSGGEAKSAEAETTEVPLDSLILRGERKGLIVGVELHGRMNPRTPIPIAAIAEIHLDGEPDSVLKFTFALGEAGLYIGNAERGIRDNSGMIVRGRSETTWLLNRGVVLDPRLKDGIHAAEMTLSPSRGVALWTQGLDRYLGEPESFPVQVEVATIPVWYPKEMDFISAIGDDPLVWADWLDDLPSSDAESAEKLYRAHPTQRNCAGYAVLLFHAHATSDAHKRALEAASLPEEAEGLYNLARFWALAGHPVEAITLLERARVRGFRNDEIASDTDLTLLRSDPRFASLVTAMQTTRRDP